METTDTPAPEADSITPDEANLSRAERCKRDIRQHLKEVGPHDWKLVMARHPDVSERMFMRYVAQVRGTANRVGTFVPDHETVRGAIQDMAQRAQTAAMKENIPHPPPPAIIAAGGLPNRKRLDYLTHIHEMLADCDRLRTFAMKVDPATGEERIHNPLFFTQAMRMRNEVLNTAISAMKALWDIQKMQQFYDAIVAEVAKVDPETGRRLMERLQELDDERGLTMNARV